MDSTKYLTRNQLYEAIRERRKNHGNIPFSPSKKKNHDGRNIERNSELRLYFNDKELHPYTKDQKLLWNVFIYDINRPLTMEATLLLNNNRVASLDPNVAPVSYKYDRSTVTKGAYHMNIISFDESGNMKNLHIDLSQYRKLFSDIFLFAKESAKIWNIDLIIVSQEDLFNV